MSINIWKFPLAITGEQNLEIPEGSRVLQVAEQHGQLYAWVMMLHGNEPKTYRFHIVGTGRPCDKVAFCEHHGSAIMGMFVWHVFGYWVP